MASTNQTPQLGLNQWIGSDKPKMEDFNRDNLKVDTVLAEHFSGNTHITPAERVKWNAATPTIGTYTGNGQMERLINLGFKPTFGIVFAVDKNIVQSIVNSTNMTVYAVFVSTQGCSQGAYVESNGFTALQTTQAMNGRIANLNENQLTYVYLMFP